jgi:hypothetical protein
MKNDETRHIDSIRQHAHRLAAEGIRAALNMWELDVYYADEADQDALAAELTAIAQRLERRGKPK